jgi:hypothetical protein
LIGYLTSAERGGSTNKLVAKACRGNVLWTVWTSPSGAFIGCDLMATHGGDWGYKDMEESMGPCYYTCPLGFLAMAPVASESWREQVRAYHAKHAAARAALKGVEVGDELILKEGCKPPWLTVRQVKPLKAEGPSGGIYRVSAKHVARVEKKADKKPQRVYGPEPACGACGGELIPLGSLGAREHFRCRACGLGSSQLAA